MDKNIARAACAMAFSASAYGFATIGWEWTAFFCLIFAFSSASDIK